MSIFNTAFLQNLSSDNKLFKEILFREEVPDAAFRQFLKETEGVTTLEGMSELTRIIIQIDNDKPYPVYFTGVRDLTGMIHAKNITSIRTQGADLPIKKMDRVDELTPLEDIHLVDVDIEDPYPGQIDYLSNLVSFQLQNAPNVTKLDSMVVRTDLLVNFTSFELSGTGVGGDLPQRFFDFPAIEELELTDNKFTNLPPEIGTLDTLTNLLVRQMDTLVGNIPSEIGNLTDLTELTIISTGLSGPVPAEISNLTNIVSLRLDNNPYLDGYTGGLSTQPNMDRCWLLSCNFSTQDVDNMLSDLVDSLGLSGRVNCHVRIENNSVPSAQGETDAQTLRDAGWTVETD